MCKISPQERKSTLILLIDDMTAAALDRSGQGYTQFLQCRNQLLKTIDSYVEEELKRDALAQLMFNSINNYFGNEIKPICSPRIGN